jgi:hypothetical protein
MEPENMCKIIVCVILLGDETNVNYARLCVIAHVQFNFQVLCDVTACRWGYSCRRFEGPNIFQNVDSCKHPQTA